MKYFFGFIFFIANFSNHSFAQSYENFKLPTEKPESGQELKFLYTGAFSKKIAPILTLYYETNGVVKWYTLRSKYNGVGIEGSFIVPKSALSFCIKARNKRDTLEAFVYSIYQYGELKKGALASAASFFLNKGQGTFNPSKAAALFDEEFSKHPELKPTYLLSYYACKRVSEQKASENEQLTKTWNDSLAKGQTEQFLIQLIKIMSPSYEKSKILKSEIIQKYPAGEVAFDDEAAAFINNLGRPNIDNYLISMELKYNRFTNTIKFDNLYLRLARKKIEDGNIPDAEQLLNKIKSAQTKQELLMFVAQMLLKKKWDLQKAKIFVEEAITLLNFETIPYYVFDEETWKKTLNSKHGKYLETLAQIAHEMGDRQNAIDLLKQATLLNEDNSIKELYLKYLLEANQIDVAFNIVSEYVKANNPTGVIKELLQKSYIEKNGSSDGYENYVKTLSDIRDSRYLLPDYCKLNVKSIDFVLNDLSEKPISLSMYKGKPVVLYFFNSNSKQTQCQLDTIFNDVVKNYKGKNIVFIAVEEGLVSNADELAGEQMRKTQIQSYLTRRNFSFNVLVDRYHYNPGSTNESFHIVADVYSLNHPNQFYIIDRNQIVKYQSSISSISTVEQFKQEFSASLKLIQ